MTQFTQRQVNHNYSVADIENQRDDVEILRIQMSKQSRENPDFRIHENQERCAAEMQSALTDPEVASLLVIGKTQVGKTGCMLSFIHQYVLRNPIPLENIFILTALSDVQWKQDTKRRMPQCLNTQVFHRPNLHKRDFVDKMKNAKNVLIIMDEIQIASAENQTVDKMFKECNLHDIQYVFQNDIKFVQFTATPDGHAEDMKHWGKNAKTLFLSPGEGYTGVHDLYASGRLMQAEDLKNKEAIIRMVEYIKQKYTFQPRYHIVRIPNSKNGQDSVVIQNFMNICGSEFEYRCDLLKKDKMNVNDILNFQPHKHTIVFIKEILRCAKTMIKKFIGIVYDRQTHSDSSIVQSLAGRLTGYDSPPDAVCFTKLSSIEKYLENFESQSWKNWNTTRDTYNNVMLKSGGEFNAPVQTKNTGEQYVFKEFDTQEDALEYGRSKGTNLRRRKEGQCPKELLVNGEFPTKEYLMRRKWGLKDGNVRMTPMKNGKWFVYHKM